METLICSKCGAQTSYERETIDDLPEGEVCSICSAWVCPDCVDWIKSGYKYDIVCKDCSMTFDIEVSEVKCK